MSSSYSEGHRYAIDIFKNVLRVLLPRSTKGLRSKKNSITSIGEEGNEIDLVNSFAPLDIKDLASDIEDDLQPTIIQKKPKSYERVYELEDDMALADYYMEIFFFFRDLHKVRLHIKKIWQDYRDGKVDLAVSTSPVCCQYNVS